MYRLYFLGTGAAIPTEKRGLSSLLLINIETSAMYMFDCGGGIGAKFYRLKKYYNSPLTIFLTHQHPDHILGILELLPILSVMGRTEKVDIIGETTAINKIKDMMATLNFYTDFKFPITTSYAAETAYAHGEYGKKFYVEDCAAKHSVPTLAYKVTIKEGDNTKTIGISGDTRPTIDLAKFFYSVDYLVFESTYDHVRQKKAEEFLHCTNIEAAQLAKTAGVGKLYLTHICDEIEDNMDLGFEARTVFVNTEVPHDGWSIIIEVS